MKLYTIFLIFFFLIIFQFKSSYSQVIWKSDGTIIGPDGETKRKSYGLRFQEQIKNPTLEWPKASLYGDNPKNYFGNNIFIPGTPLLRMSSIDHRSDYLTKLSELNNFDNILDLQKFIIGNANSAFLEELNISEDAAIIFLSSKLNKLDNSVKNINFKKSVDKKINDQLFKFNEKIDDQINKELENNIEEQIQAQVNQELESNIEEQIQDQVNQELESNIEEQIQDQIFESLNDYFDRLEEEYKAKGWVVCERTENSIMASSSSDGCT